MRLLGKLQGSVETCEDGSKSANDETTENWEIAVFVATTVKLLMKLLEKETGDLSLRSIQKYHSSFLDVGISWSSETGVSWGIQG